MLVRWAEGQQRSGSLGATVASHNRFGSYLRPRTKPVNPNTDRQVEVRNYVQNLTIAWATQLTQAQRDAWDLYGQNVGWLNKQGDPVNLTGLNHYVRSNVPGLMCGLPRLDDAPTIFNIAPAEQSLAGGASEVTTVVTVTFNQNWLWASETGGFQIFYMGAPQNAAIKFFNGPYRKLCCSLGQDAPNGEPSSPLECPGVWPFAQGQRIWIKSRIRRADGRLSEFAVVNFLAGA